MLELHVGGGERVTNTLSLVFTYLNDLLLCCHELQCQINLKKQPLGYTLVRGFSLYILKMKSPYPKCL